MRLNVKKAMSGESSSPTTWIGCDGGARSQRDIAFDVRMFGPDAPHRDQTHHANIGSYGVTPTDSHSLI